MHNILINEIREFIGTTIHDRDLSLNQQVDKIYRKFRKYNGMKIYPLYIDLDITREGVLFLIRNILATREGNPLDSHVESWIHNLATVMIRSKLKKWFF